MTSGRILVTGGLGHIGSALIRESDLLNSCSAVTIVDNLQTQRYCSLFNLPDAVRYTFIESDVVDMCTPSFIQQFDAVVHLAGTVDPVLSATNPSLVHDNNLRITQQVVLSCAQSQTPLIYVSTTSVYTSRVAVVDETCRDLDPKGAYAQCKLAEEDIILTMMGVSPSIIMRLGTIVGPSPGMRFQTAVNKFCWQAVTGQPVEVWTSAIHQTRPYLALPDCTRAIAFAVRESLYPRGVVNMVSWNCSVQDVLDRIRGLGIPLDVKVRDSPLMSDLSFAVSTNLAETLGFQFTGTLEKGVSDTLRWLGPLYPYEH